MKLFDILPFDLTHELLAFKRTQNFDWFESSCVLCFPHSFTEGIAGRVEAFTALGLKQGTGGELLRSETFPEDIVPWLLEHYFRYCDAESAIAHYRGNNPSLQANVPRASGTSSDYYTDVNSEAGLNRTD